MAPQPSESRAPLRIELEFSRSNEADDPFAFQFGRQAYRLRTSAGGYEVVNIEWSGPLLDDLALLQQDPSADAVAKRVGRRLRELIRDAGWRQHARRIRAAVELGQRVVVVIRPSAAELFLLPWELTHLATDGQPVGQARGVLLRFEWPERRSVTRSGLAGTGPVLLAWSAAGGGVPLAEQSRAIAAAVGEIPGGGQTMEVVSHASLAGLVRHLRTAEEAGRPISVLHLLCHGSVGPSAGFGLVLNGEDADRVWVSARELRMALQPFAASLGLVMLATCHGGSAGSPEQRLGSVARALHRSGIATVVGFRAQLSVETANHVTRDFYTALLARAQSVESAFLAARDGLGDSDLRWASIRLHAGSPPALDHRPITIRPYRGLLRFEARHAALFHGRRAESEAVCVRLDQLASAGRPRLLIVTGASGSGKSSIVRAGVVPRRLAMGHDVTIVRPTGGLASVHATLQSVQQSGSAPKLMVVDQFEEIFTDATEQSVPVEVQEPSIDRNTFVQMLWRAACDTRGTEVLLTIRVDFLGRLGELQHVSGSLDRFDRVGYDEQHRVFVAGMGSEQLRAVIEAPAAMVGLRFDPGLVDVIVQDVASEPGALPLLSYSLDAVWQRRQASTMTQAAYTAIGRVPGALHQMADALLNTLTSSQKVQARRALVRLVRPGSDGPRTRRQMFISDLRPPSQQRAEDFDIVVQLLVEARLLVRAQTRGEPTLEVAHEMLIRRWPRLARWLREDGPVLAQVEEVEGWARQFEKYKTLVEGARLSDALRVRAQFGDQLSLRALRLVSASEIAAKRATDLARRRSIQVAVVALVIALITSGLAIWAVRSRDEAESARQTASFEARRARDQARIAQVRLLRTATERVNLLREVEAPSDADGWFSLAVAALLENPPEVARWTGVEAVDPCLAATSTPGTDCANRPRFLVRDGLLTEVGRGAVARLAPAGESRFGDWIFAPDGRRLYDKDGRSWVMGRGWGHNFSPSSYAILLGQSRDGRMLVFGGGGAWVVNAEDGLAMHRLEPAGPVFRAAFVPPDDRLLATLSGWDGGLQAWDLERGQLSDEVRTPDALRLGFLAFEPSGGRYMGIQRDAGDIAYLYHTATGQLVETQYGQVIQTWSLEASAGTYNGVTRADGGVVFAPDGKHALYSRAGMVATLALDQGQNDQVWGPFDSLRKEHHFLGFSPSGEVIVAVGSGGVAFAWERRLRPPHFRDFRTGLHISARARRVAHASGALHIWESSAAEPQVGARFRDVLAIARSAGHVAHMSTVAAAQTEIEVWRPPPQAPVTIPAPTGVFGAALSADGGRIALLDRAGLASVWEVVGGEAALITSLSHPDGLDPTVVVPAVALSSAGDWLLVGRTNGRPVLWNVGAGAHIEIPSSGGRVTDVAFAASGERFAVAYPTHVDVVDLNSWRVRRLHGAGISDLRHVALSDDGGIVVATENKAIHHWLVDASMVGQEPTTIVLSPTRDHQVKGLSPDATHVAISAGGGGMVVPLDMAHLQHQLWCFAPRCLSRAERISLLSERPSEAGVATRACLTQWTQRVAGCDLPDIAYLAFQDAIHDLNREEAAEQLNRERDRR